MSKFHELYISRQGIVDAGYPTSERQLVHWHNSRELVASKVNGKAYYCRKAVDDYFIYLYEIGLPEINMAFANDNSPPNAPKRTDGATPVGRPTKKAEVEARRSAISRIEKRHGPLSQSSRLPYYEDDDDLPF